jgi:Regulator of RNA terminal phosphate cyclase
MAPSIFQRLFNREKPGSGANSASIPRKVESSAEPEARASHAMNQEDRQSAESGSAAKHAGVMTNVNSLFAFVDRKDPFTPGEIAGEQLPGPILSIMSAQQFRHLFLFHTPQTRENAAATEKEASSRYPECHIVVNEILVSDPKDFSSIMGRLARTVRKLMNLESSQIADCYVCVSSGTAEMRAAWFLLAALNVLPAKMLQVGSPSRPLFGEANVKEVRIDTSDWVTIRDLAMPDDFFRGDSGILASQPRAAASGARGILSWLRRENKKPDEAVVQEKARSGRELFEESFAEQMWTRYGDLETDRRWPSLREWVRSCFDLMLHDYRDEELSTDQFRDFGRELFGLYEDVGLTKQSA